MSNEEKFNAAVNVIRNLPKNGPVQPSHHVMLKFYAYFKQATEGPNVSPKPAFWDIVKKAKWDAWNKLGDMDKETAMKNYVDEFKTIVETVGNSNVDNIDKSEIDSFYASVPVHDLELLVGKAIVNKGRSRSSSPVPALDDSSPEHKVNGTNGVYTNGIGKSDDEDEDDEFFLDTIENSDHGSGKFKLTDDKVSKICAQPYANGYAVCVKDDNSGVYRTEYSKVDSEMNQHITNVITSLQKDLEKVVKSVNLIEQRIGQLQGKIVATKSKPAHSHFMKSQIIPFVVLFSWPVILQLLIIWFRRRK